VPLTPGARRSRLRQREGKRRRSGDPVRFRARLVQDGTLSREDADRIAEEVRAEMEGAVQFGLDSPFPPAEAATEYVYA
jgi:TPP-dependent pyruvate/acetoin dehydrogenase alpha subunit